jgi:predicted regulator of amino acid metabolism with ACT domain
MPLPNAEQRQCKAVSVAKAIVFGMDERKTVRRAIERILANRELEKFNSLEIVRVASLASKRFLGICHVTVSAQSRHIQESPVIFQVKDKHLEVAVPIGIELRPDQSIGLSTGKELPLGEIKTPKLESVRI